MSEPSNQARPSVIVDAPPPNMVDGIGLRSCPGCGGVHVSLLLANGAVASFCCIPVKEAGIYARGGQC